MHIPKMRHRDSSGVATAVIHKGRARVMDVGGEFATRSAGGEEDERERGQSTS